MGPFHLHQGRGPGEGDAGRSRLLRQVHHQRGVAVEDHRPLDHVAQLPDVARPAVAHQGIHVFLRYPLHALAEGLGELLDHGPHEQRDVVPTLPQGRDGDGKHVQTVVEIFPETPFSDRFRQVSVGGGDDPDVYGYRRRAAQPLELPLLEHAKELRLQLRRQFADFVQEYGRTVGRFETPYLRRQRTGEGALLPPEQFGLDQGRREGGAVELDHGAVLPAA